MGQPAHLEEICLDLYPQFFVMTPRSYFLSVVVATGTFFYQNPGCTSSPLFDKPDKLVEKALIAYY